MSNKAQIISDSGKGKAIVLVYESGRPYKGSVIEIAETLSEAYRSLVIEITSFDQSNWETHAKELESTVQEAKIRYGCIVAFGGAGSLVQHLYLSIPKAVRSLVFIDPTTRPHPTYWTRIVSAIEAKLPTGLPLRSADKIFHGKPFLQRFRCPVMIISTSSASPYQKSEAEVMLDTLPTAWKETIPWSKITEKVPELILDFQSVNLKSPQRKRA